MQRLLTVILACLGMVGALAIDTYLPSILAIGREFSVGSIALQQTEHFPVLFRIHDAVLRHAVGFLRPPLAPLGAVFAPTFGWLMVCDAQQGLSAGAGSVIGAAIVQDRVSGPQAQKIMAHIMMVFGLAPALALAPILGCWLHFGWRSTSW